MEGKSIYEESFNVLSKLAKQNTASKITIEFNKLDTKTASELRSAIAQVITSRKAELTKVIIGIQ